MALVTADEESLKIKIGKKYAFYDVLIFHLHQINQYLRFGDWKVVKKLDEGGFGKVFQVQNIKDPSRLGALKAEPSEIEGGAAIKLEVSIFLFKLQKKHAV